MLSSKLNLYFRMMRTRMNLGLVIGQPPSFIIKTIPPSNFLIQPTRSPERRNHFHSMVSFSYFVCISFFKGNAQKLPLQPLVSLLVTGNSSMVLQLVFQSLRLGFLLHHQSPLTQRAQPVVMKTFVLKKDESVFKWYVVVCRQMCIWLKNLISCTV